jgi:hypothetical protein
MDQVTADKALRSFETSTQRQSQMTRVLCLVILFGVQASATRFSQILFVAQDRPLL